MTTLTKKEKMENTKRWTEIVEKYASYSLGEICELVEKGKDKEIQETIIWLIYCVQEVASRLELWYQLHITKNQFEDTTTNNEN